MNFFKKLLDRRPKVTMIVEMPAGTLKKVEIKNGIPIVDRELKIPVPVNYGYIPGTLAEDGDPLDIFLVSGQYLQTRDIVQARIIGMFECLDQGVQDNKILAVADGETCQELEVMAEVANYLLNYKPGFQVLGWKKISLKEIERYNI